MHGRCCRDGMPASQILKQAKDNEPKQGLRFGLLNGICRLQGQRCDVEEGFLALTLGPRDKVACHTPSIHVLYDMLCICRVV